MQVELGWPLKYLCCVARNVNAATGSNKARLPDAIFKHAEKKLFADLEVYKYGTRIAFFMRLYSPTKNTPPSVGILPLCCLL